jgi:pimeloyl-ACP methyl ester carboxylesterase
VTVVFVHGLEGRPDGAKPTALREGGFEVFAPDGRGRSLADRIAGAQRAIDAHPGAILVGSSYGGLAAAWIASVRPDDLRGLVLLAPALFVVEPPVGDPAGLQVSATLPTRVLHGTADAVVPVACSRRFVAANPHAVLTEVDDDHALRGSLPELVAAVRALAG